MRVNKRYLLYNSKDVLFYDKCIVVFCILFIILPFSSFYLFVVLFLFLISFCKQISCTADFFMMHKLLPDRPELQYHLIEEFAQVF